MVTAVGHMYTGKNLIDKMTRKKKKVESVPDAAVNELLILHQEISIKKTVQSDCQVTVSWGENKGGLSSAGVQ